MQKSLDEKWLKIVLFLLLGLALAAGLVFARNKLGQRQVRPVPTVISTPLPTLTPELTPTPDPTADWETYTNTKYGFTLRYPQDFEVFERTRTPEKSTVFTITLSNTDTLGLQVIVDSEADRIGLKEWWLENFFPFHGGQIGNPGDEVYHKFSPDDFTLEEDYFQEHPALIATAKSVYEEFAVEHRRGIVCSKDGGIFYLILPVDNPIFDQILSTFKFLPSVSSGQRE